MKSVAPASIEGSRTSWKSALNGTTCSAPTSVPSGSMSRPVVSSGALPAVSRKSAGSRISGTSYSDALPATAPGLARSYAASSAWRPAAGAAYGTG